MRCDFGLGRMSRSRRRNGRDDWLVAERDGVFGGANRNDDIPKEPIEWTSLIDVFVEVVVRICRLQRAALSIALDRTSLFVEELG